MLSLKVVRHNYHYFIIHLRILPYIPNTLKLFSLELHLTFPLIFEFFNKNFPLNSLYIRFTTFQKLSFNVFILDIFSLYTTLQQDRCQISTSRSVWVVAAADLVRSLPSEQSTSFLYLFTETRPKRFVGVPHLSRLPQRTAKLSSSSSGSSSLHPDLTLSLL